MQKIQNETEIQLAQINGNVRQGILSINRYYDLEVQKVVAQYKLKSEEMNLYYQNLEKQRKEQERRFDKMIKIATTIPKIAALTGIGAGIGIGLATSKATDAIARQPEADGKMS